jgi:hypothetical protein
MILLTQMFIITESDTFGQLRYRTSPHLQKAIPTERFAITPPTSPNSDSYGALRYRIPTSSKQRAHPHIPKAIPRSRFAIASPHPKSDR